MKTYSIRFTDEHISNHLLHSSANVLMQTPGAVDCLVKPQFEPSQLPVFSL